MIIKETTVEALAFRLGQEEYGVDILKVRGNIVPIVDLRLRFNLDTREQAGAGVVIVLNIAGRVIGMVVDAVSDVVSLGADEILPAPRMGTALDTEFLLGIGTIDERMLILLDIERLLSSEELGLIKRLAA